MTKRIRDITPIAEGDVLLKRKVAEANARRHGNDSEAGGIAKDVSQEDSTEGMPSTEKEQSDQQIAIEDAIIAQAASANASDDGEEGVISFNAYTRDEAFVDAAIRLDGPNSTPGKSSPEVLTGSLWEPEGATDLPQVSASIRQQSQQEEEARRERISIATEERMAKKRARYEAAIPVAMEILEEARRALAVRFRFFDRALWKMPLVPNFDIYGMSTDGRSLVFDPVYIVDRYRLSFNEVVRDVLHSLLHCIFRHPFMLYSVLRQPWDVACDIAIESIIIDLVGEYFPSNMDRRVKESMRVISAHMDGVITAERLYHFFGNEGNHTDLKSLGPLFFHDSHALWYADELDGPADLNGEAAQGPQAQQTPPPKQSLQSEDVSVAEDESQLPEGDADVQADVPAEADGARGQADADSDAEDARHETEDPSDTTASQASHDAGAERQDQDEALPLSKEEREELEKQWEEISRQIQIDLETHLSRRGEGAGSALAYLRALNRDVGNYDEFLRRFAALHETMRVNDEEFDYIYYTYGLDRYGNMPLVEPLEYKDDKKVHDLVIAIDTSESCSGEVVKAFMNKTYSILKASDSFADRVNIHIVQCDAKVQEDTIIDSLEHLEQYLENFELKGFGGTDFRPVFEYVDTLVEKGEFADLRGLIYFTDGEGVYPTRPPSYDTAFIFLDDGYSNPEVPAWALKSILTREELEVA